MNGFIRITPVRVIGADGEQVGVIETQQAIAMAQEKGFDLVEISPDARPPVCKIMDYGKFKYEQSKQTKNKGAKASELKEVRLGRSVKIDPHDVGIRVKQARGFLLEGHKVLITQRFKGREMAHRELGINRLRGIRDELSDIAKCETEPRWMGPQASIIMAPEKAKCDAYKKLHKLNKRTSESEKRRADKARVLGLAAEAAGGSAGGPGIGGSAAPAAAPKEPGTGSAPVAGPAVGTPEQQPAQPA
ncbi:MAG: translation initiation factor IF-3 [Phycisphaerales bacterium]